MLILDGQRKRKGLWGGGMSGKCKRLREGAGKSKKPGPGKRFPYFVSNHRLPELSRADIELCVNGKVSPWFITKYLMLRADVLGRITSPILGCTEVFNPPREKCERLLNEDGGDGLSPVLDTKLTRDAMERVVGDKFPDDDLTGEGRWYPVRWELTTLPGVAWDGENGGVQFEVATFKEGGDGLWVARVDPFLLGWIFFRLQEEITSPNIIWIVDYKKSVLFLQLASTGETVALVKLLWWNWENSWKYETIAEECFYGKPEFQSTEEQPPEKLEGAPYVPK